jgi:hypothetical protein
MQTIIMYMYTGWHILWRNPLAFFPLLIPFCSPSIPITYLETLLGVIGSRPPWSQITRKLTSPFLTPSPSLPIPNSQYPRSIVRLPKMTSWSLLLLIQNNFDYGLLFLTFNALFYLALWGTRAPVRSGPEVVLSDRTLLFYENISDVMDEPLIVDELVRFVVFLLKVRVLQAWKEIWGKMPECTVYGGDSPYFPLVGYFVYCSASPYFRLVGYFLTVSLSSLNQWKHLEACREMGSEELQHQYSSGIS